MVNPNFLVSDLRTRLSEGVITVIGLFVICAGLHQGIDPRLVDITEQYQLLALASLGKPKRSYCALHKSCHFSPVRNKFSPPSRKPSTLNFPA